MSNHIDWDSINHQILSRLNLTAECEVLGIRFDSGRANAEGWAECYSIDRDENKPSAAVNIASENGLLGRYTDLGPGGSSCSFWDLAVRRNPSLGTWEDARRDYARKTGVELPGERPSPNPPAIPPPAAKPETTIIDGVEVLACWVPWIEAGMRTVERSRYIPKPATPSAPAKRGRKPRTIESSVEWREGELAKETPGIKYVAKWEYLKADGSLSHYVVRFDHPEKDPKTGKPLKTFRPLRPDGDKWLWSDPPGKRPLYKLPTLAAAPVVFLHEGEKAADATASIGLPSTTSSHGAKSAKKTDWKPLAGKVVAIFRDNDDGGKDYGGEASQFLIALDPPAVVKLIDLPDLPPKGDAVEFVGLRRQQGKSDEEIKAELLQLVESAATSQAETKPRMITNMLVKGDAELPMPMRDVLRLTAELSAGWPRRVGSSLFVPGEDDVHWLPRTASVFGWLSNRFGVDWHGSQGCVTKDEFCEELKRTTESYISVEKLPHEPPLPGHFYACPEIEPGDGNALREFIGRFEPATDADSDLIKAAIMTVFWGGHAGTRPAFVVTSDTGRGAGKSKLVEMIAHLAGGVVDFSKNEDIGQIKGRLLSPDALTKRVALLDNVKSMKFSWAELESLITCPAISGKKMYVGEGSRPNTICWFITLNGAALSTDMAQRSVIIKIKRPSRTGSWEEDTLKFVLENRWKIIADVVACLQEEPVQLERFSRWATWEKSILARIAEPSECQAVVSERQSSCDVEEEEVTTVEEFFSGELAKLGYKPDAERIFIPSPVAARWLELAIGEKRNRVSAGKHLGQFIREKRTKFLRENKSNERGRGIIWEGEKSDSNMIEVDLEIRIGEAMRAKQQAEKDRTSP